jgi:uncharacterized protein (TIGR02145 family)
MKKTSFKLFVVLFILSNSCSKNSEPVSTEYLDDKTSDHFNSLATNGTEYYSSKANYLNIQDIEGNIYKTIMIGKQTWMADNLRTRRFKNGDKIKLGQKGNDWYPTTEARYCVLDQSVDKYTKLNGRIYNYYTIEDSRGICPEGWRVPNATDFQILAKTTDSILKTQNWVTARPTVRQSLYRTYYEGGINNEGLTLCAGGYREEKGENGKGQLYFDLSLWTTSKDGGDRGKYVSNVFETFDSTNLYFHEKNVGHSIRCIKK